MTFTSDFVKATEQWSGPGSQFNSRYILDLASRKKTLLIHKPLSAALRVASSVTRAFFETGTSREIKSSPSDEWLR